MPELDKTPSGERLHISIFGRRNSGKSSLINALTNQQVAIVSEVAGTTTDPVAKAMEILPLGPVVITDTAGIDDLGSNLGKLRVQSTLRVLEKTDLAVLVVDAEQGKDAWEDEIADLTSERQIPLIVVVNKTDLRSDVSGIREWAAKRKLSFIPVSATERTGIEELKREMMRVAPSTFAEPTIIGDLISAGDIVVLVVPIDSAAPKGRLILPQVMTLRDVLDHDAYAVVVKESELAESLRSLARKPRIVVTDSQAFERVNADTPPDVWMTGFSILMARYKGDLAELVAGAAAIGNLKPGDKVLIAEGCTHHRQKDDIGSVKIPRWLGRIVGGELQFGYSSGKEFPPDLATYKLVVHCGGCMLNRREMLYRQQVAREAGVPMINYGVLIAYVHGIMDRALEPFPDAKRVWEERANS